MIKNLIISGVIAVGMAGNAYAETITAEGVVMAPFALLAGEPINLQISSSSNLKNGTVIVADISETTKIEDKLMGQVKEPVSFETCIISVVLPDQRSVSPGQDTGCLGYLTPKNLEFALGHESTIVKSGSTFYVNLNEDFPISSLGEISE